jgi:hypothetical protein
LNPLSEKGKVDIDDNHFQMISGLVERLDEVLSIENESVDRITSRISQTPIQELNLRLKQHLSPPGVGEYASKNQSRFS